MHPSDADTVLVRHGEIGTKSDQVQRRMERRLQSNLRIMLAHRSIDAMVEGQRGRIYIRTDGSAVTDAHTVATDTFGVASASMCVTVEPTLDVITSTLASTARGIPPNGPFAVDARRAGQPEEHPFRSKDIEEVGGSAIWDALDDPVVDLDDPAQTYYAECRPEEAFIFLERTAGPGGFPLGTQGTVVALISGGIDSPVAAWEAMRRGCRIIPVYFDFEAYGGPDHVARALESVRTLASYVPAGELKPYVIPIGDPVALLVENVGRTRMLSLRRLMFAIAARIADREGAHAIVTGESIGQKSSQTGVNIAVTSADVRLPIHRPLLDRDKEPIIAAARKIGTYQEARIDAGCNRVAPVHPETNATRAQVVAAEPDGFMRAVEPAIAAAERPIITARPDRSPIEPVP